MTEIYDNWGRLVRATLRREELLEIPSDLPSLSGAATTTPSYRLSSENGEDSSFLEEDKSFTFPHNLGATDYLNDSNQSPPRLVYINGRPLSPQELLQLHSCRNPPKKIKPGRYWYDKISGYWGKVGHPPSQVISPMMDIGGILDQKASNGKSNVMINGREITKKELWMLRVCILCL
ncbi:OLC1v1003087C1 [Oldenlandia corymbosa var. corymbosa]|uniref:OLC1v1003087C1 n=1 Tax=Oldenlandia corymbosa var. corymbosa TaxID=529605 RepID=A0AAV1D985_OLDCO|nr:OLC1v1003087C1 [Oldenlandia corymbosa var. corymbosa]